MDIKNMTVT